MYRITRNFNVSADVGLAARRTITLSGSLEKNAAAYYKSKIDNGAYFGVGIKYIFHSLKKDKEKDILNLNKEKEEELVTVEETIVPVNPLINTETSLVQHDSKGFYEALNRELRKFLATQLGVPVETINKKRIAFFCGFCIER